MKKKTILPRFAHFDGAVVPYEKAKVSVLTHALNYGTAVFGGLRAFWNREEEQLFVFRPEDHFTRFLESTRLLNMDLPETPASLTRSLKSLLTAEALKEDTYIRPLAFYADEGIGVKLHGLTPAVSMVAIPFDHYVANEEGLHVTVSSWRRVDDNTIPPRGKIAGAYVNSAFAKTDALRAGFDEAIVLNRQGHVSEGTAANFFIVRNGRVATPPTSASILEGITRRTAMQLLADEIGIPVDERPIDRTELYLSDEAFFTGTGIQIAAITRIDHRNVGTGQMGPIVTALRKLYFDVVRGRTPKYRGWCSPVYGEAARVAEGTAATTTAVPAHVA